DGVPPRAPASADADAALAISTLLLGEPERALAIALDAARRLDRDAPGSPAAVHAHGVASAMASSSGDPIAGPEAELALPPAPPAPPRRAPPTPHPPPPARRAVAVRFRAGERRRPRRRARRVGREHRARPSGREPRHVGGNAHLCGGRAHQHRRPSPRGA